MALFKGSNLLIFIQAFLLVISYYIFTLVRAKQTARTFARSQGCAPARRYPQSDAIIGYGVVREFKRQHKAHTRLQWVQKQFRIYGSTFSLKIIRERVIFTEEPENIKHVLATGFQDFGLGHRERVFSPLLGKGIFDTDGEAWQHSRALVRPAFTKSQVADLNLFETHVQPLLASLPTDGSTVDLGPLFFQLTADVTFDFLFGDADVSPAKQAYRRSVCAAFDYAQSELGKFGNHGLARHLFPNSKFNKSCKLVHDYVDSYVHEALAATSNQQSTEKPESAGKEKYVFLNELVKATRDPLQIRNELLNILLAGRDTTASLLTESFHVLSRNPEVWTKLRREVDTLGGELPNYETLRDMRYLRNFLNETLRLYPVVPMNARTALRATTIPLGGGPSGQSPVYIPKGGRVTYSVWAMHRNPSIYGCDAHVFRPERWESEVRQGWHYLPFNGGPRICPGQQFALTEASYTIVRMLQRFARVERRDMGEWVEQLALTLTSREGAKVALFV